MKHLINYTLSFIQYVSKCFSPRILFIIFVSSLSLTTQAATDRFAPPSLNAAANTFDTRFTASSFNVDFLLSHILNNSRQIENSAEELRENTKFFTDQVNSIDGAISNSVIIPPGTVADTIIILNQNEGDSFAIQR